MRRRTSKDVCGVSTSLSGAANTIGHGSAVKDMRRVSEKLQWLFEQQRRTA